MLNKVFKLGKPTVLLPRFINPVLRINYSDAYNYNDSDGWYRKRIGNREVVGFGINGEPAYFDRVDYPFPSIRFSPPTSNFMALREKEKGDWHSLALAEKKSLYRLNYCQTIVECTYPTGQWMHSVGGALILVSCGIWLFILMKVYVYGQYPLPSSYEENNQKAQLRRMLLLHVNPITGISSKWDYEKKKWKKKPWYIPWEDPFEDDCEYEYP